MGPRPDGRGRRRRGFPRRLAACVNGAAAGWPRKAAARTLRRRGPLRVNGAAAGWPRKAYTGQWSLLDAPASMGPRPDGRGRSGSTHTSSTPGSVNGAAAGWPRKVHARVAVWDRANRRQWGRGRMAAEGIECGRCRDHATRASMGPRPDGRGRRPRPEMKRAPSEIASMGPRPDGRGRCFLPPPPTHPRPASMGPRPDGRGRPSPPVGPSPGAVRQWGRGRMAAEGRAGRPSADQGRSVNGAAAGWPRKGMRAIVSGAYPSLRQWGRGRMAAEGCDRE